MKVRTFGQMPDEPALHIQIQFVIMVQTSIFVSFKNYLGDSSLVKVLTDIREGRNEPPVLELRKKLSDGDKDGAEQIKKGLPAFTVSAEVCSMAGIWNSSSRYCRRVSVSFV